MLNYQFQKTLEAVDRAMTNPPQPFLFYSTFRMKFLGKSMLLTSITVNHHTTALGSNSISLLTTHQSVIQQRTGIVNSDFIQIGEQRAVATASAFGRDTEAINNIQQQLIQNLLSDNSDSNAVQKGLQEVVLNTSAINGTVPISPMEFPAIASGEIALNISALSPTPKSNQSLLTTKNTTEESAQISGQASTSVVFNQSLLFNSHYLKTETKALSPNSFLQSQVESTNSIQLPIDSNQPLSLYFDGAINLSSHNSVVNTTSGLSWIVSPPQGGLLGGVRVINSSDSGKGLLAEATPNINITSWEITSSATEDQSEFMQFHFSGIFEYVSTQSTTLNLVTNIFSETCTKAYYTRCQSVPEPNTTLAIIGWMLWLLLRQLMRKKFTK